MDWQTYATVLFPLLSGVLYTAVQATFFGVMRGRSEEAPIPRLRPWVSVLKPLAGVEDGLRENLESFARMEYPAFEILFGVASAADPAVSIVRGFLADHPEISARLVITRPASEGGCGGGGSARGARASTVDRVYNPKVAQLIDLTREARGSVIVVSDANTRVKPTYLRSMVSALLEPGVGLVSSVIVGRGERTLGAALDNAVLGAAVAPFVVAAHALGVKPVTVGKSMAMRKEDLERAGGWESVARVLAEDDVMGQRFDALGYKVVLSHDPVENHVAAASVRKTLDRHARWATMRRSIVPYPFLFEPLLQPLVTATLVLAVAQTELAALVWAMALGLQLLGAWMSLTRLRVQRPLLLTLLEPLRTVLILAVWIIALVDNRARWRGHVFSVGAGSRLSPVDGSTPVLTERVFGFLGPRGG